ncbi:hypothetical protein ACIRD4_12000 [Streptomyces clavifer]|uniref:hypothetical protein n=1 Tax=Streptomyces clavifer TaxID=68188 RepID=UPI003802377E
MSAVRCPERLFRHSSRLLLGEGIGGWVALCDGDALFEFPFDPQGLSLGAARLGAVAACTRGYPDSVGLQGILRPEVHAPTGPATIVAEGCGVADWSPRGSVRRRRHRQNLPHHLPAGLWESLAPPGCHEILARPVNASVEQRKRRRP